MQKRILFLTTAHFYNDDRIFYHQAKSLVKLGFSVKICSLSSSFSGKKDGILVESENILDKSISAKKKWIQEQLIQYKPHLIICSEPLPIIASQKWAKKNRVKIIYDVTEWYPSQRMIANYKGFSKIIHFFKFIGIQIYAGWISAAFIFGEPHKQFPLANIFPFKKRILLPYFPSLDFVKNHSKFLNLPRITLCYTGVFSEEKGFENFISGAYLFSQKRKDLQVNILLIGASRKKSDEKWVEQVLKKYNFENLSIQKPVPFEQFTEAIAEADICFDLRKKNFENDHCLPIKIFYYAAAGKPVIYTQLKAIKNFINPFDFGFLVDPANPNEISDKIDEYCKNTTLYKEHSQNARLGFEQKYNWQKIEEKWIEFIQENIFVNEF